MTQTLAFGRDDIYAAPFPPRTWPVRPLTVSLIAAIAAVNACAVGVAVRLGTFSDPPILHYYAASDPVADVQPIAQAATQGRLAVLDAPTWSSAPPLQLATLTEKARQMSAELKGDEAAGVIDAIDPENNVADNDNPAPACIACDTIGVHEQVDIIPATKGDDAGEPEIPAGYDATAGAGADQTGQ